MRRDGNMNTIYSCRSRLTLGSGSGASIGKTQHHSLSGVKSSINSTLNHTQLKRIRN